MNGAKNLGGLSGQHSAATPTKSTRRDKSCGADGSSRAQQLQGLLQRCSAVGGDWCAFDRRSRRRPGQFAVDSTRSAEARGSAEARKDRRVQAACYTPLGRSGGGRGTSGCLLRVPFEVVAKWMWIPRACLGNYHTARQLCNTAVSVAWQFFLREAGSDDVAYSSLGPPRHRVR